MKQSSIQWLEECLKTHLTNEQQMQFEGLFQQAKEMHKQEIIEATKYGNNFEQGDLICETYYKKNI